jgi:hypothetical protein
MFEGSDVRHSDRVVETLRAAHTELKNIIALHPDYQDNEALARLDAVYKDAGWDDNGLRWTSEYPSDMEDIFIVEFKDATHETWDLA